MRNGTLKVARVPYGYRKDQNGNLIIDEEKAAVIRRIFRLYLSGLGARRIAKNLNEELIPSPTGIKWGNVTILKILAQEKYTGDILWQKTRSCFMGPKWKINRGEADSYYIRNSHPAIIDRDTFQRVSDLRLRISRSKGPPKKNLNPFRSKLICSCGRSFLLFRSTAGDYWKCSRATDLSHPCTAPRVRDAEIRRAWEGIYERVRNGVSEGRCDYLKNEDWEEIYGRLKNSDWEEILDRFRNSDRAEIYDRLKNSDQAVNIIRSEDSVLKEQTLPDSDSKDSLLDVQEAIRLQRYILRKRCLEERITPSQLAVSEAELDQKLNQVNLSMKQSCLSEERNEEAFFQLQKETLSMCEDDFLKEMLESVSLRYEEDAAQTTAVFNLKGNVQYVETIRPMKKKKRHSKEEQT